MLVVEIVAYLLIAFQLDLALCMPQSQNFNGSNPYYDSYLNQYGGVNSFNNGNNNNQNPCKLMRALLVKMHVAIKIFLEEMWLWKKLYLHIRSRDSSGIVT